MAATALQKSWVQHGRAAKSVSMWRQLAFRNWAGVWEGKQHRCVAQPAVPTHFVQWRRTTPPKDMRARPGHKTPCPSPTPDPGGTRAAPPPAPPQRPPPPLAPRANYAWRASTSTRRPRAPRLFYYPCLSRAGVCGRGWSGPACCCPAPARCRCLSLGCEGGWCWQLVRQVELKETGRIVWVPCGCDDSSALGLQVIPQLHTHTRGAHRHTPHRLVRSPPPGQSKSTAKLPAFHHTKTPNVQPRLPPAFCVPEGEDAAAAARDSASSRS